MTYTDNALNTFTVCVKFVMIRTYVSANRFGNSHIAQNKIRVVINKHADYDSTRYEFDFSEFYPYCNSRNTFDVLCDSVINQ